MEQQVGFEPTTLRICNPLHLTTLPLLRCLATREGFEPPTFGFGDQRSARLNYRAINWYPQRESNPHEPIICCLRDINPPFYH
jgi:hypothetical protein